MAKNKLKEIREQMLLSKAELARKAGVSPMTIDRIENAENCRMETMRKVLVALDISLEDRGRVFPDLT